MTTNTTPLAYLGTDSPNPRNTFYRRRAPTSADLRAYTLGDRWIDTAGNQAYILVNKTPTTAFWQSIGASTGALTNLIADVGNANPLAGNLNLLGTPDITFTGAGNTVTAVDMTKFTDFVVGPLGQANYQTIQSALNAANIVGGGLVYARKGIYIENLTFYPNIQLIGDSEQATFIVGTHIPPASGTLNIFRVTLQSATDIFNSAAAGTTAIIVEDCTLNVTNGYSFNLPNWIGSVALFDIGPFGVDDGGYRNTAGGSLFIFSAGFGNGSLNSMVVSGLAILFGVDINCPTIAQSNANIQFDSCIISNTITTTGTASVSVNNSRILTGALECFNIGLGTAVQCVNVNAFSNAPSGFIATGTGTINKANIVCTGTAIALDPALTITTYTIL